MPKDKKVQQQRLKVTNFLSATFNFQGNKVLLYEITK